MSPTTPSTLVVNAVICSIQNPLAAQVLKYAILWLSWHPNNYLFMPLRLLLDALSWHACTDFRAFPTFTILKARRRVHLIALTSRLCGYAFRCCFVLSHRSVARSCGFAPHKLASNSSSLFLKAVNWEWRDFQLLLAATCVLICPF